VGGINNVSPPSMHSLLRKKVAGLGAKYLKQEQTKHPFIKKNITKYVSTVLGKVSMGLTQE
jgi:hypothetical protein